MIQSAVNIDFKVMRSVCLASIGSFYDLGLVDGPRGRECVYIQRGGSLLAVGHLDTFGLQNHFGRIKLGDGLTVFSPSLDDRLGVYALLHLLPSLLGSDSVYDLLLTTGEESGLSSASSFSVPAGIAYNWVFELDRRGRDAVTYGIDTKKFRKCLGSSGWSLGLGSYSDIAELGGLGVCAVNFGIAYEAEHTKLCRVNIEAFKVQVSKIARFIKLYSARRFDYVGGSGGRSSYKSYGWAKDSSYWSRWSGRQSNYGTKATLVPDGCFYCNGDLKSDIEIDEGVCLSCLEWERSRGMDSSYRY